MPTLRRLMQELMQRLLDENVGKLEYGQTLLRSLNTLMVRVLENSNKNDVIKCVLMGEIEGMYREK